jgi:hypothetical protein
MVRQPDATMQPAPQDIQLMSKHRVLSFKPQLRLEWRGQDGQSETEQPDHSTSLGDSITSSHSDKVFGTHRVLGAHLPDQRAQFYLDSRSPSPRVRFPTPIAMKAGPMPPHQRFRSDNRNDLQDRWKPSIHLDEEPAIVVGSLSAPPHPAPQDDQLMSEHRILSLKPDLRLEW